MNEMTRTEPAGTRAPIPADLAGRLIALMDEAGGGSEGRAAVLIHLKEMLGDSRSVAEAALYANGGGTACATRLCRDMDAIVCAVADLAAHVFHVDTPSQAERLALLATGGYGRGTLAPGSDIDLLFLRPYKQTPWGESVVEFVLYMLWDLGLKVGHATRSLDECLRHARADMTIRTAILEARHMWGAEDLSASLIERFDKDVAAGTGAEFVAAKLAERDERLRRHGSSRYVVEPNVKEGKGGQRDLNTLFWIAKYVYRVRTADELVPLGVLSRAEMNRFKKCEDFLWAVRCHLHFMTGRAEERLAFDIQQDMARRLGYTEHAGLKDVERFMKHYFLVAKDVGDLTNIVCAGLEEREIKASPGLSRFVQRLRRRPKKLKETTDFIVEGERLNAADDGVFERDPVNLVRMFHLADRTDRAFHPDLLRLARRSLKLIDARMRDNEEANALFLQILTSRNDPETTLRRMNETGVLGRFVPEFGRIVAMMQFNMYHHYTVDEHLIRSIGLLAAMEAGTLADEHPLCDQLLPAVQNRTVLYVALFLHDIAKGRPEDHSLAGARIARRLCPRFGLSAAETDTVAWLVEHHLTMSITAQSRDLADPKTIETFADTVQSLERLKLLLILTVADIRAVGPGVWNGWKGQLLRSLYYETEPVLAGGHSQASRTHRVAESKAALREALSDWSDADFAAYAERHYQAYWLKVDLDHRIRHARLIADAVARGDKLATIIETDAFQAITELTVLAPDHTRLLSVIAGACAASGANIVDAQIFTTSDGFALDSIYISRAFADPEDERRRARRIAASIEKALKGDIRLPDVVESRTRSRGRVKAFSIEPDVLINNTWSEKFTVIEISGLDRPGLLYDLTRALSRLNLNIASAHVATFGERAVDVFYVTDLIGQKVTNANRQAAIRRHLLAVFDPAEKKDGREGVKEPRRRVGARA